MGLSIKQGIPDVLLVGASDGDAERAAQVHRFGRVEERGDSRTSGDSGLQGGGLKGATGTVQVVKGADIGVGAAVDRPGVEGDAQDLGQAPKVVTKDIPQVAKDSELGVVLTDVFVNERRR